MSQSIFFFFAAIACLFVTAFFTLAETALISSDRVELAKRKKKGETSAQVALKLLENIDLLLSTTQFGANLFVATATTLATLAISRLGYLEEMIFFLALAPLTLIFSDSLPKIIARNYSDSISLWVSIPLQWFSRLFYPVIFLISKYTDRLSKFFGLGRSDSISRRRKVREELHSIVADQDGGSEVRLGHKRIIRKLLDFPQQNVKKVMLPFVNVDAVEKTASIQQAISLFETLRHSRLPVYDDRIDNIVGVLYFQDVFQCHTPEQDQVDKFMRQPLFVPETQQLETLTKEMKEYELAVVVDEYGGAVGIVTKEDILEEIVGDISDEWDEHNIGILEISENSYLVQVTTTISDLNEKLKLHVPKGEYETFSGFLLQQFNRIPSAGDELYFSNFKVRVHRANPRAIETVIIDIVPGEKDD